MKRTFEVTVEMSDRRARIVRRRWARFLKQLGRIPGVAVVDHDEDEPVEPMTPEAFRAWQRQTRPVSSAVPMMRADPGRVVYPPVDP